MPTRSGLAVFLTGYTVPRTSRSPTVFSTTKWKSNNCPLERGIVLLLLFVAVDTDDDRPLIIDQPEENLDPKSIYDDLVDRFKTARLRRQIIIITHNANLVVNTDADQVIVAECGPHRPGYLPKSLTRVAGLKIPRSERRFAKFWKVEKLRFGSARNGSASECRHTSAVVVASRDDSGRETGRVQP